MKSKEELREKLLREEGCWEARRKLFVVWLLIIIMAEQKKKPPALVYHEKQRLQLCLLHALNNLLQGESSFSKAELDGIANKLSCVETWNPFSLLFRPHYNVVTGNYDVNVLLAALQNRGKEVVWCDRRKGAASLDLGNGFGKKLVGVVLNQTTQRFGGLYKDRHWVALRKVEETWYNLDSDLATPKAFPNGEEDVKRFLERSFCEGAEVLIVLDGGINSTSEQRLTNLTYGVDLGNANV